MQQSQDEAQVDKTAEGIDPSHSVDAAKDFSRFLLWLLLPPAVLYVLLFLLALTPALRFERWGPTKWGPVLQFAFDAHKDADVVIFGDSSAFLGIDPRLVNAELGITSVVLPNTIGSLPISGELSLRRYLSRNRSPKFLVLYFTAWDLDYRKTAESRVFFEGEEMLLQNGSLQEILRFGRRHPFELLAFPLRLNSTIGLHLLATVLHRSDRERQTDEALGHVDFTDPYPPLEDACAFPASLLEQRGDASLRSLLEEYGGQNTRVLVYLAPVPDCKGAASLVEQTRSDLRLQPPTRMPPRNFTADGLYAHPRPALVPETSHLLAAFLRPHIEASRQAEMKTYDDGKLLQR